MKKFIFLIVLLISYTPIFAYSADTIHWKNYSNTLFSDAKAAGRPVFMLSHSAICDWCKKMNETTLSDPKIIKLINDRFYPASLDVDQYPEIADRYNIMDLPTTIIFDLEGKQVKFIGGYISTEKLLPELEKISPPTNTSSLHIKIIGSLSDATANELYRVATQLAPKNSTIERIDSHEKSAAFICADNRCALPAYTPQQLERIIKRLVVMKNQPSTELVKTHEYKFNELLDSNNWWVIIPSFWFIGFLLALTPCVLPLLIIITSIIGASDKVLPKRKAFLMSLVYVIALASTYAIAGITVASFGFYFQGYMQSIWSIGLFSFVFILLGLSSLGFFNLQIPNSWRKTIFIYNKTQGNSYLGVALMGVLATLIASPCVAAPLAGLLAYVTKSGNVKLGAITLFSMGLGIGTPLIIISTIGSGILQRAGKWQSYIKKIFGILLLGIAVWLLNRVMTSNIIMLLWAALAIFTAVYMGALTKQLNSINSDTSENLLYAISKTMSLMILIYGIALIFGAYLGNTNPLAPLIPQITTQLEYKAPLLIFKEANTLATLQNERLRAKKENKPILLFFTAKWCSACNDLKEHAFTDKRALNLLQKFILLEANLTDPNHVEPELMNQFNIAGPPVLLFFTPNGDLSTVRFDGAIDAATFVKALESILKKGSA